MKTANTAVTTMIVALVAMIGMTGFAMAGSTVANYVGDGSYHMNFDGMGTGSMVVNTYTSLGEDHMGVGWTDTNVNGRQNMYTDSDFYRDVTVGTGGHGQDASGYIQTYTTDGGDNSISTSATYHDDVAWGSNVHTNQNVDIHDSLESGINNDVRIDGFAYGDDTLVTGSVGGQSGNMSTFARMEMTEGNFTLNAYLHAYTRDYTTYTDAGTRLAIRSMVGAGAGNATIAGSADTPSLADFNLDVTDDAAGYHANGNANNFTAVNFHDEFDDGYTVTGPFPTEYIYVYNLTD